MARSLPECCPPAPTVCLPPGYVCEQYTIRVLTPVTGGGVRAGHGDEVTPIRVPAIRGHLRFWWRATVGVRQAADLAALRRLEGALWGTTRDQDDQPRASQVSVSLASPVPVPAPWPAPPHGQADPLSYVYGMFQHDAPPERREHTQPFTLVVACPAALLEQVRVSVWAWVNFGGLGARTRRGCGALRCTGSTPAHPGALSLAPPGADLETLRTWYASWAACFPGPVRIGRVPALAHEVLVGAAAADSRAAWTAAVKMLREFRQGENVGRDPRPNPAAGLGAANLPGQSRWPEPDAIQHAIPAPGFGWGHPRRPRPDAFPRAAFGLPIQFAFKEKQGVTLARLTAVGSDRMASPVIVRPLATANNLSLPLIVRLAVDPLDGARFEDLSPGGHGSTTLGAAGICDPALSAYADSPLGGAPPRSAAGCALEGFLAFARERGYGVVVP